MLRLRQRPSVAGCGNSNRFGRYCDFRNINLMGKTRSRAADDPVILLWPPYRPDLLIMNQTAGRLRLNYAADFAPESVFGQPIGGIFTFEAVELAAYQNCLSRCISPLIHQVIGSHRVFSRPMRSTPPEAMWKWVKPEPSLFKSAEGPTRPAAAPAESPGAAATSAGPVILRRPEPSDRALRKIYHLNANDAIVPQS